MQDSTIFLSNSIIAHDTVETASEFATDTVATSAARRFAIEGIARNTDFVFGDLPTLVILIALIIGGILLSLLMRSNGRFLEKLDGYVSGLRNFTLEWDLTAVYFVIIGLCGYSLFFITCFSKNGYSLETWKALAETALFFIVKLTIVYLYSKTFFRNSRNSMARLQTLYFATGGLSALILFLFAAYSPFSWLYVFIAIFSLVQAILTVSFFAILYVKFFSTTRLVFEYILYLCTLEVLPAAALLQMLKRTLLITY